MAKLSGSPWRWRIRSLYYHKLVRTPPLPPVTLPHTATLLQPPSTIGMALSSSNGNREFGALFDSEMWWRDQYQALETQGYILRPRYHPDWRPSWKRSGKDFFAAEDGQPTLVSVVCLSNAPHAYTSSSVSNRDGWNTCTGRDASDVQEDCEKSTEYQPIPLFSGAHARAP